MVQIRQFSLRALDGSDDRISLAAVPVEVLAAAHEAQLPDPDPILPAISQAELEEARQEGHRSGYQEGMQAGLQQAKTAAAQLEQQATSCLGIIQAQLAQMVAQHSDTLHRRTEEVGKLAFAIANKVAGHALKQDPLAEIEAMAQSCLSMLAGKLSVSIRLHPTLVDAIDKKLRVQMEQMGITAEVTCVEDSDMAVGDCRISWEQGEAVRDSASLWKNIERLLSLGDSVAEVKEKALDEVKIVNE